MHSPSKSWWDLCAHAEDQILLVAVRKFTFTCLFLGVTWITIHWWQKQNQTKNDCLHQYFFFCSCYFHHVSIMIGSRQAGICRRNYEYSFKAFLVTTWDYSDREKHPCSERLALLHSLCVRQGARVVQPVDGDVGWAQLCSPQLRSSQGAGSARAAAAEVWQLCGTGPLGVAP